MKVVGLAMLKPQDVVVLLKIHTLSGRAWTFEKLGKSLLMQPSQVHSSLKRAEYADLYFSKSRSIRPHGLLEFLEHGIRYAFATKPGEVTRGIPTAHSSTPLNQYIVSSKGHTSGHGQQEILRGLRLNRYTIQYLKLLSQTLHFMNI
jgi:hypothetical protein